MQLFLLEYRDRDTHTSGTLGIFSTLEKAKEAAQVENHNVELKWGKGGTDIRNQLYFYAILTEWKMNCDVTIQDYKLDMTAMEMWDSCNKSEKGDAKCE